MRQVTHEENKNDGSLSRYVLEENSKIDNVSIFGISIWNGKMSTAVDWIIEKLSSTRKITLSFVNANNLNLAYKNKELSNHYQSCDRVFADGSGIKIAAKIAGKKIEDNVNGTDMLPILCRKLEHLNKGVYFLGGKIGVAKTMAQELRLKFPELKISGFHHGYVNDDITTQRVINNINLSGASLLLVAMGTPIQETWVTKNQSKIDLPAIMSVGGLFDFYSGNISRAPKWMRVFGVEWIWRLIQEPSRMWRRYILGNPLFIFRAAKEVFNSKCIGRELLFSKIKRCFDVVMSALGLLVLSPFLLLIIVCIKYDSNGSAFYSQTRIGKRGEPFQFWKFRSMVIGAHQNKGKVTELNESKDNVLFKIRNDPRVTRVGRILRRFSLDELPQLWNVLTGEMSLVGPRPALPEEVSLYSKGDFQRFRVKPGITCYWQINGRSNLSFKQQIQLDKKYISERSILTDLKILIKTIPAVIGGEGAY